MKKKLLYILGANRSGSTLLSAVLNGLDGFVSVGEMRYFWERGWLENWMCSCGQRFHDCDFWTEVTRRVHDQGNGSLGRALGRFSQMVLHRQDRIARLMYWKNLRRFHRWESQALAGLYQQAFDRVFEVSGARVVVESSKLPSVAHLYEQMDGYELYLLHMVRDPRAVTYSEHYRKRLQVVDSQRTSAMVMPLWLSLWRWRQSNRPCHAFEKHDHYLRLRYETFVEQPAETLRQIARFVGEDPQSVQEQAEGFAVGDLHIFSGNPSRMAGRSMAIRHDREWETKYPALAGALVRLATVGMRKKYGY